MFVDRPNALTSVGFSQSRRGAEQSLSMTADCSAIGAQMSRKGCAASIGQFWIVKELLVPDFEDGLCAEEATEAAATCGGNKAEGGSLLAPIASHALAEEFIGAVRRPHTRLRWCSCYRKLIAVVEATLGHWGHVRRGGLDRQPLGTPVHFDVRVRQEGDCHVRFRRLSCSLDLEDFTKVTKATRVCGGS